MKLAELRRQQVRRLLADIDRVVAEPLVQRDHLVGEVAVRERVQRASRHTFIQTRYGVGYRLEPGTKDAVPTA